MIATINLLPRRQARRYACLRFWGILFSASLLLSIGVLLRYYSALSVENRAELLLADAEKTRAEALMALKPRMQQRQQRWQQVQARNKQREQTRSWQRALQGLAELLPEQAWLTKMTAGGHAGTDGKHTELCRIEGIGSAITPVAVVYVEQPRRNAAGCAGTLAIPLSTDTERCA